MHFSTAKLCSTILFIFKALTKILGEDWINCNPSLEGSEQMVNVTWYSKQGVLILREDDDVSFCGSGRDTCFFLHPFDYKHNEIKVRTGVNIVSFRLPNVTLASYKKWRAFSNMKRSEKFCIVTAFNKDIKCHKTMLNDLVSIQCVTKRVSPKLKCVFKITSLNAGSNPIIGKIEYTHRDELPQNVKTDASCKVPIMLDNIVSSLNVEVTMFPDATNDDSDMIMGVRKDIPIDLSLSANCSIVPEGGTSQLSITWNTMTPVKISRDIGDMTIICLADKPCDSTNLEGYAMSTQPASNGRSTLTLSLKNATRLGFSQGVSVWIVKIIDSYRSVTATCRLYDKRVNITCSYQSTDIGINMTCITSNTLQSRKFECLYLQERIVPKETFHYEHTENDPGYKSYCNALVPWNMINLTQPIIEVKSFPYLLGNEDDINYGQKIDVKVSLEKSVNLTCSYQPTASGLNMFCLIPKSLLRRKCQFKLENKERVVRPENITYQHTVLKNDVGYKTYCNTSVPWNMIDSNEATINVTNFPNYTGDADDINYGQTTEVKVVLESPSVELKDCPQQVEKGEKVSCTCTGLSNKVNVSWSSPTGDVLVNDITITFVALAFQDLRCKGINSMNGIVGAPKIYNPEISYPPHVMYGRDLPYKDIFTDKLYITCKGQNDSYVSAKLVEDSVVFSWKTEPCVQEFKRNMEQCPRSKLYKCISAADYEMPNNAYTGFTECESIKGSEQLVDTYIVYFLIFFAVDFVFGGLFILWKVKPEAFLCMSRQNVQEDEGMES